MVRRGRPYERREDISPIVKEELRQLRQRNQHRNPTDKVREAKRRRDRENAAIKRRRQGIKPRKFKNRKDERTILDCKPLSDFLSQRKAAGLELDELRRHLQEDCDILITSRTLSKIATKQMRTVDISIADAICTLLDVPLALLYPDV